MKPTRLLQNAFISPLLLIVFALITFTGASQNETKYSATSDFDYIIFGRFCGECFGPSCTVMYKYEVSKSRLFVDHTKSFWEGKSLGSTMKFPEEIREVNKIVIAKQIFDSLSHLKYVSDKNIEFFGCPDCGDQCGLFLAMRKGNVTIEYFMDYNIQSMSGEIKEFASFLKGQYLKL